jgi:isocitrate/isopropylmalate dehydrogenase/regulator of RNase E activity RraA
VKPTKKLKIAVLPGDGIGKDVTKACIDIFTALDIPVALTFGDIGWSFWQNEGTPIPDRTWQLIHDSDTTLLGAITSKPEREAQLELSKKFKNKPTNYVSPIIQLRQRLELFANVRPSFTINEKSTNFNLCIIRENTEGLYSGFDYHPLPRQLDSLLKQHQKWQHINSDDISCSLRLQSKQGLARLFQFAFDYANKHGFSRVTFADKPNVLRQSSAFARELFESYSQKFPHIKADILNVDAVGLWIVRRPEKFGVIVAENMFGDILSDVGAGIMGGLGVAPSANIGPNGCYFEPVHGSAPSISKDKANPCAMFLTISMLLNHFSHTKAANIIKQSVMEVINKQYYLTYDLGGNSTTKEMAHAIIDTCLKHHNNERCETYSLDERKMDRLTQLKHYSTSQVSDALDSCGIEGVLLNIKPLSLNRKLIGPAYTVKYTPYDKKPDNFKNAANYIDEVDKDAVIVIDNDGHQDCTTWGDILTQVALQKGIKGTIVNGAIRDVEFIRNTNYPIYCLNHTMRSGKNRVYMCAKQCPLTINGITIHPGDIIFGDDNGVLVIPKHLLDDVIAKVKKINITENKIIDAVKSGENLKNARTKYHYDKPWIDDE